MKIWSSSKNVPAAAITFVGNDNNYPILFTTQHMSQSSDPINQNQKLEWAIRSIEVTNTRDWGTSTAMIVLACHVPNVYSPIPRLPNVHEYRGGNYPYLTYEDEIRIFAGYLDSPITPITGDMLEHDMSTPNEEKVLAPIFWGFIDKVDFSGSETGLQIILSCRDRTRVLADTRLVSIDTFLKNPNTSDADDIIESASTGNRINIARSVINGANGRNTEGEEIIPESGCWRPIVEGKTFEGFKETSNGDYISKDYEEVENPARWMRDAALKLPADKANPRFNIWLERPPIKKGRLNSTLQIINKTPYQILDNLAKTDERPMDFFSSHVNGDFILGPRVLDTSGFTDSLRSYRTYFFRGTPPNKESPSANQMILSMRTVSTTLGTFNRFVVVESSSKGGNSSLSDLIRVGFEAMPWQLFDRSIPAPCRSQVIYDGAISAAGGPQEQEAAAFVTGLAAAQISARDVTGIQMELLGDPTFYPGEAVQVYNTVLHDDFTPVISDIDAYEKSKYEGKATSSSIIQPNLPTKNKTLGATTATEEVKKILIEQNKISSNIADLVLPRYKVRTIRHKITAQGERAFRTTIVAVSDY